MSLVFYQNNLVEGATITPSTVNAQYPASNIKDERRTKVYRSTSNSDNVVFDLGSTEDIDAVCISPNWQTGFGFTAITIEGNGTDSWSSPAFSQSFSFDSTFGIGIQEFSATQSYRFWRLVITSTLGYCELANVFIGPKTDIATNGIELGWGYRNMDLKNESKTVYGQVFTDDIAQKVELDGLSISTMSTAELDVFYELYDNVRTVKPFWIKFSNVDSVLTDADRYNGIYRLTREPKITNTSAGFYKTSFSLEEQK